MPRVANLDGTDETRAHAGPSQDGFHQIARAGLAVGSGDPDQAAFRGGFAEETRSDGSQRSPGIGNHHRRVIGGHTIPGSRLDQKSHGPQLDGLVQVIVPVADRAAQSDEEVTGGDLARIVYQAADHRILRRAFAQPLNRGEVHRKGGQQSRKPHHPSPRP